MLGRNNLGDMHVWVEARLSDYVDNQLPSAERTQLEQHLSGCAQCRSSLESLRWTISLVKQAPVPALKRSFTLAVTPKSQPTFAFGFARLATVLATLLLIAVFGVDAITQFGGASAPAMAPAKSGATAQDVALAPTLTVPAAELSAPSTLPTSAPMPTVAPKPTQAPPVPAALPPAPTKALEPAAATGAPTTRAVLEGAPKLLTPTSSPRQPIAGAAVVTATFPAPTATFAPSPAATLAPTALPSPTTIALARGEPTRVPASPPVETPQPPVTPLRVVEIGLLFFVIFFGVLTILLQRK